MTQNQDQLAINAIRMLSVDMINQANSGHPGLPLGAAPMTYALWTKVMNHNPENSHWANRDRFVLSAGHGSALLYSLLHLCGYRLSMEDLKNFRQLHSKTPGHPEVNHTDGVEATTGPLGQGIGNAVGMAMAEKHLAAVYNKEGYPIVDHYTYALCGDGDLMEGVSGEACSLAGHLKLGKLILLYDSNDISLDGPTSCAFTEHVGLRFKSYGWQVLNVPDGNDWEAVENALEEARKDTDRPTLIEVKTVIGFGAPNQGTSKVHGAPIGAEGRTKLAQALDWKEAPFALPEEAKEAFAAVRENGAKREEEWNKLFASYEKEYGDLARRFRDAFAGKLPQNLEEELPSYTEDSKAEASRKYSAHAIQKLAELLPDFWGGSADLSSSNNTMISGSPAFVNEDDAGRNIWFGVREFAMGTILNGIMLHGGSRAFGATFFVFSDYLKAAVRVAALSGIPVTYVFTHDSIAVGEDGPTHEPIEQLAQWRALPNCDLIRPADGNEVSAAWACAVESEDHPTLLALSRQGLPNLAGTQDKAKEGVRRGAYVLVDHEDARGILLATGSEVSLAVEAQKKLAEEGIFTRVVSVPSFFRFDQQDESYKEEVLPDHMDRRLSIEAGTTFGWGKYVGRKGLSLGLNRFGLSGKGEEVREELGFTADRIVQAYKAHFLQKTGE